MIETLYPSYMKNSELRVFALQAVEIMKEAGIEDAFIKTVMGLVEKDVQLLEDAVNKERGSEYTEISKDKDTERDDAFVALRDFVKACTNRRKPEIREAAEKMIKHFEKHGYSLYNLGYTEQSAKAQMLIEDLETEESKKAPSPPHSCNLCSFPCNPCLKNHCHHQEPNPRQKTQVDITRWGLSPPTNRNAG